MARTLAKCALPCSGKDGTAAWFTVKYRRMCGICDVIGIERSELGEATTRRMMEALWHRGPDEDGLLVAPSAALGMRRLSIIDLPGGAQPIFNESGDVGIVFKGEAARPARIFLARDRLGIKPLYYAYADGALFFASEVRALIASGRVAPKV